ncbi:hypothetical protein KFL_002980010 [Klebsormidium nitens]|uniref:Uncharacterized protein n=1 Tax=Klebsormidium nitens TaxID=105231 RepID=A0A1Y1ICX5_KLENI|nr:hypothetical protein KFL_002980010 [Klebsormidium nitens]|eukprot:GAQ86577.1 hypothetical protein KFL_002980010 [Klebsormidium nitens]
MAPAKRATKKASPTSKAVTYSKKAGKTLQKVSGSLRGKGIPKTLRKNLKSSQTGLRTLSKRAQIARANLKSKTAVLKSKGSKDIKAVAKVMKQRLATANKHLAALKALRKSKKTGSMRKSGSKQDIPLAKWKRNKKKSRGRKKKSGGRKKKSGSRKKKTGGRKKRGKRTMPLSTAVLKIPANFSLAYCRVTIMEAGDEVFITEYKATSTRGLSADSGVLQVKLMRWKANLTPAAFVDRSPETWALKDVPLSATGPMTLMISYRDYACGAYMVDALVAADNAQDWCMDYRTRVLGSCNNGDVKPTPPPPVQPVPTVPLPHATNTSGAHRPQTRSTL